jgi:hypothetical protein
MRERVLRRRRPLALTVVAAVVLVATGTGASAYFSAGGTGTAQAGTATTEPVVVTAGTPVAQLYPGGAGDVTLTVSNPNLSSVTVRSLSLDTTRGSGGYTVDAAHSTCTFTTLTYTSQDNGGTGWIVPARVGATNGTLAITLPSALSMSTASPSSCQGATFTLHLTAGT